MNKKKSEGLRTWIEIDTKALKHNFQIFRTLISKATMLGAVVKSNAYGHDLLQFTRAAEELGIDWIMVDSIVEALALRVKGIHKPILVLGYTLPSRMNEAIQHNISLTISGLENLKTAINVAKKYKRQIKAHIKTDTGLSRQGFLPKDQQRIESILKHNSRWIKTEGLYTHFSAAQNPTHSKSTDKQLKIFQTWIDLFRKNGQKPVIHAAATAATLIFEKTHFDLVRIGIGLYGLWPSIEIKKNLDNKIILKPVLTWKTIINEIKSLPKSTMIGYDATESLFKNSRLAVCPIGYWHGYSRRLSSIGYVLVKGQKAKVVGRVSMDMIVVDVSSIQMAKEGDEVVLLGKQGQEEITAYEMAALDDTSWYETLTRLNPLIKRLYI